MSVSALLSCCWFPECTTYKLEVGNHLNKKQPLKARAVKTTGVGGGGVLFSFLNKTLLVTVFEYVYQKKNFFF